MVIRVQRKTLNIDEGIVLSVKLLGYEKFTIEQFFIACVAANNSKFNIQNSKFIIGIALGKRKHTTMRPAWAALNNHKLLPLWI